MNRAVKIAIAVALLILVAAVLVSPAVDLAPTALRAALWIAALFASIAAVAFAISGFRPTLFRERVLNCQLRISPNLISLTDLDCPRRC